MPLLDNKVCFLIRDRGRSDLRSKRDIKTGFTIASNLKSQYRAGEFTQVYKRVSLFTLTGRSG
ncbi:MAG: hypothetical protein HC849_02585 [Oscillatoriales cyanobacterium RU_3_3]|nr:hypothetical protein [Oscillatoriales cyanobacterium RU_3_3]